jgi:MFS family permease
MKNPLTGIPKNAFVLGTASLLNDIASEMIAPLLPIFLTVTLGAGPAALGLIEGIAETTSSFLKIISGYVSDRIGKRKAIVFGGYGIAALARPLIAATTSWFQVLILRFSDRVGKGIRTAPRDALLADSADVAYRGKVFGFHRALDNAGAVVGPLIAFLLIYKWGFSYRTIFALTLIPGLLSVSSIAAFIRERKLLPKSNSTIFKWDHVDTRFYRYLVVLFLFTLGNASDAFLILRAVDAGMPKFFIPVLWSGFNLVKFLVSTPGGSLSDRIGRRPVIVAGWFVYAVIYAAFAFASTPLHIILIFAGYGVYYGLTEGVERAFVADLVPENIRATAYGLYNAVIGFGALPASVLFGLIWKYYGVQAAFFWAVAMAAASAIGLLLFVRQPNKS